VQHTLKLTGRKITLMSLTWTLLAAAAAAAAAAAVAVAVVVVVVVVVVRTGLIWLRIGTNGGQVLS
jgi:hypothetical protein